MKTIHFFTLLLGFGLIFLYGCTEEEPIPEKQTSDAVAQIRANGGGMGMGGGSDPTCANETFCIVVSGAISGDNSFVNCVESTSSNLVVSFSSGPNNTNMTLDLSGISNPNCFASEIGPMVVEVDGNDDAEFTFYFQIGKVKYVMTGAGTLTNSTSWLPTAGDPANIQLTSWSIATEGKGKAKNNDCVVSGTETIVIVVSRGPC